MSADPITVTCPSCSRTIKVPLPNADITPETYAQVHRYAQRADGGRSMNESEEALLSDLKRVTAERDALKADLAAAAGEVLVPIPAPGTDASRMLLANVLMRRDRDEARALFRDAVHMMAHIARAAGFDPEDTTVEPPAIVARVERLRRERGEFAARLDAIDAPAEVANA